jgi:hypothetical protein
MKKVYVVIASEESVCGVFSSRRIAKKKYGDRIDIDIEEHIINETTEEMFVRLRKEEESKPRKEKYYFVTMTMAVDGSVPVFKKYQYRNQITNTTGTYLKDSNCRRFKVRALSIGAAQITCDNIRKEMISKNMWKCK